MTATQLTTVIKGSPVVTQEKLAHYLLIFQVFMRNLSAFCLQYHQLKNSLHVMASHC